MRRDWTLAIAFSVPLAALQGSVKVTLLVINDAQRGTACGPDMTCRASDRGTLVPVSALELAY